MSQLHALAVAHMEHFFYGVEAADSDEDIVIEMDDESYAEEDDDDVDTEEESY